MTKAIAAQQLQHLRRPRQMRYFDLGLLIFVFYFTSKILLYYQHLLVNMEQCSKKDLDSEQVHIS